jgi:hypothetical protein
VTLRARFAERRSERLIEELLTSQAWDLRHPPAGDVLTQQEYKDYAALREASAACSKPGSGAGVPDFVLVDRRSIEPLAVFEAKARGSLRYGWNIRTSQPHVRDPRQGRTVRSRSGRPEHFLVRRSTEQAISI